MIKRDVTVNNLTKSQIFLVLKAREADVRGSSPGADVSCVIPYFRYGKSVQIMAMHNKKNLIMFY